MPRSATIGACRRKSTRFTASPCEAGSRANSAASASSRSRAAGSTEFSTLVPGTCAGLSLARMSRSIATMDLPNATSMIPACRAANPKSPGVSAMPVKITRQPSPSATSSQPLPTPHRTSGILEPGKGGDFLPFAKIPLPAHPKRTSLAMGGPRTRPCASTRSSDRKGEKPVSSERRAVSETKGHIDAGSWRKAAPGDGGRLPSIGHVTTLVDILGRQFLRREVRRYLERRFQDSGRVHVSLRVFRGRAKRGTRNP